MIAWSENKKLRFFIRVISIIIIQAFLLYDITWATGGEIGAHKLSPPSIFQQSFPNEKSIEFKNSILSDIRFLTAAFSIGACLLTDNLPVKYVKPVVEKEFSKNIELLNGFDLDSIEHKDSIVSVKYSKGGKYYIIRICSKEKLSGLDKESSHWAVSAKFGIQIIDISANTKDSVNPPDLPTQKEPQSPWEGEKGSRQGTGQFQVPSAADPILGKDGASKVNDLIKSLSFSQPISQPSSLVKIPLVEKPLQMVNDRVGLKQRSNLFTHRRMERGSISVDLLKWLAFGEIFSCVASFVTLYFLNINTVHQQFILTFAIIAGISWALGGMFVGGLSKTYGSRFTGITGLLLGTIAESIIIMSPTSATSLFVRLASLSLPVIGGLSGTLIGNLFFGSKRDPKIPRLPYWRTMKETSPSKSKWVSDAYGSADDWGGGVAVVGWIAGGILLGVAYKYNWWELGTDSATSTIKWIVWLTEIIVAPLFPMALPFLIGKTVDLFRMIWHLFYYPFVYARLSRVNDSKSDDISDGLIKDTAGAFSRMSTSTLENIFKSWLDTGQEAKITRLFESSRWSKKEQALQIYADLSGYIQIKEAVANKFQVPNSQLFDSIENFKRTLSQKQLNAASLLKDVIPQIAQDSQNEQEFISWMNLLLELDKSYWKSSGQILIIYRDLREFEQTQKAVLDKFADTAADKKRFSTTIDSLKTTLNKQGLNAANLLKTVLPKIAEDAKDLSEFIYWADILNNVDIKIWKSGAPAAIKTYTDLREFEQAREEAVGRFARGSQQKTKLISAINSLKDKIANYGLNSAELLKDIIPEVARNSQDPEEFLYYIQMLYDLDKTIWQTGKQKILKVYTDLREYRQAIQVAASKFGQTTAEKTRFLESVDEIKNKAAKKNVDIISLLKDVVPVVTRDSTTKDEFINWFGKLMELEDSIWKSGSQRVLAAYSDLKTYGQIKQSAINKYGGNQIEQQVVASAIDNVESKISRQKIESINLLRIAISEVMNVAPDKQEFLFWMGIISRLDKEIIEPFVKNIKSVLELRWSEEGQGKDWRNLAIALNQYRAKFKEILTVNHNILVELTYPTRSVEERVERARRYIVEQKLVKLGIPAHLADIRDAVSSEEWVRAVKEETIRADLGNSGIQKAMSKMGRDGLYSYFESENPVFYRNFRQDTQSLSPDFNKPGEKFRIIYSVGVTEKRDKELASIMPITDEVETLKAIIIELRNKWPNLYRNFAKAKKEKIKEKGIEEFITKDNAGKASSHLLKMMLSWEDIPLQDRLVPILKLLEITSFSSDDEIKEIRNEILTVKDEFHMLGLTSRYWQGVLEITGKMEGFDSKPQVKKSVISYLKEKIIDANNRIGVGGEGILQFFLSGKTISDFLRGNVSFDCSGSPTSGAPSAGMHYADTHNTVVDPAFFLFKVVENGKWIGNIYSLVVKDNENRTGLFVDVLQISNHPLSGNGDNNGRRNLAKNLIQQLKDWMAQDGFNFLVISAKPSTRSDDIGGAILTATQEEAKQEEVSLRKAGSSEYAQEFGFSGEYVQFFGNSEATGGFRGTNGYKIMLKAKPKDKTKEILKAQKEIAELQKLFTGLEAESVRLQAMAEEKAGELKQLQQSHDKAASSNRTAVIAVLKPTIDKKKAELERIKQEQREIEAKMKQHTEKLERIEKESGITTSRERIGPKLGFVGFPTGKTASLIFAFIGFTLLSIARPVYAADAAQNIASSFSEPVLLLIGVGVGLFLFYKIFGFLYRILKEETPTIKSENRVVRNHVGYSMQDLPPLRPLRPLFEEYRLPLDIKSLFDQLLSKLTPKLRQTLPTNIDIRLPYDVGISRDQALKTIKLLFSTLTQHNSMHDFFAGQDFYRQFKEDTNRLGLSSDFDQPGYSFPFIVKEEEIKIDRNKRIEMFVKKFTKSLFRECEPVLYRYRTEEELLYKIKRERQNLDRSTFWAKLNYRTTQDYFLLLKSLAFIRFKERLSKLRAEINENSYLQSLGLIEEFLRVGLSSEIISLEKNPEVRNDLNRLVREELVEVKEYLDELTPSNESKALTSEEAKDVRFELALFNRNADDVAIGDASGDCTAISGRTGGFFYNTIPQFLFDPGFLVFRILQDGKWVGNVYTIVAEKEGRPVLIIDAMQLPTVERSWPVSVEKMADKVIEAITRYGHYVDFQEVLMSSFVSNFSTLKYYYDKKYPAEEMEIKKVGGFDHLKSLGLWNDKAERNEYIETFSPQWNSFYRRRTDPNASQQTLLLRRIWQKRAPPIEPPSPPPSETIKKEPPGESPELKNTIENFFKIPLQFIQGKLKTAMIVVLLLSTFIFSGCATAFNGRLGPLAVRSYTEVTLSEPKQSEPPISVSGSIELGEKVKKEEMHIRAEQAPEGIEFSSEGKARFGPITGEIAPRIGLTDVPEGNAPINIQGSVSLGEKTGSKDSVSEGIELAAEGEARLGPLSAGLKSKVGLSDINEKEKPFSVSGTASLGELKVKSNEKQKEAASNVETPKAEAVPTESEGFKKVASLIFIVADRENNGFWETAKAGNEASRLIHEFEKTEKASKDEIGRLHRALNSLRKGMGSVEGVRQILYPAVVGSRDHIATVTGQPEKLEVVTNQPEQTAKTLQEEKQSVKADLENLQKEKAEFIRNVAELKIQLTDMQEQLRQDKEKVEANAQVQQKTSDEIKQLEQKKAQYIQAVAGIEEQCKKAQEGLSKIAAQKTGTSKELEQLRSQLPQVQAQIQTLQTQIQKLESEKKQYQDELSTLQNQKSETQKDVGQLNQEKSRLQEDLKGLKQQVSDAKTVLEEARQKAQASWKNVWIGLSWPEKIGMILLILTGIGGFILWRRWAKFKRLEDRVKALQRQAEDLEKKLTPLREEGDGLTREIEQKKLLAAEAEEKRKIQEDESIKITNELRRLKDEQEKVRVELAQLNEAKDKTIEELGIKTAELSLQIAQKETGINLPKQEVAPIVPQPQEVEIEITGEETDKAVEFLKSLPSKGTQQLLRSKKINLKDRIRILHDELGFDIVNGKGRSLLSRNPETLKRQKIFLKNLYLPVTVSNLASSKRSFAKKELKQIVKHPEWQDLTNEEKLSVVSHLYDIYDLRLSWLTRDNDWYQLLHYFELLGEPINYTPRSIDFIQRYELSRFQKFGNIQQTKNRLAKVKTIIEILDLKVMGLLNTVKTKEGFELYVIKPDVYEGKVEYDKQYYPLPKTPFVLEGLEEAGDVEDGVIEPAEAQVTADLKGRLSGLNDEIAQRERELAALNEEKKTQSAQFDQEIQTLKRQREQLAQDIEQLQKDAEVKKKEQVGQETTSRGLEQKIDEYREAITNLERQKDEAAIGLSTLQDTLKTQAAEIGEKLQEAGEALRQLKEEIASLGTQKEDLESELAAYQSQKAKLETEITTLTEKSQALSQAISGKESSGLKEGLEALKVAMSQIEEERKAAVANVEILQTKCGELSAQIAALESQKNQYGIELDSLRQELANVERDTSAKKTDLDRDIAQRQEKLDELNTSVSALGPQKNQLEQAIVALKEQEATLSQKSEEERQANALRLNQQIDSLIQQKSDLAKQITALQKDIEVKKQELSASVGETEEQVRSLREEASSLKQELAVLKEEKEKIKAETEVLDQYRKEAEEQKQELADLEKQKQAAQEAMRDLESQQSALKEAVSKIQHEFEDTTRRLKEEEEAVKAQARLSKQTLSDEQKKLQEELDTRRQAIIAQISASEEKLRQIQAKYDTELSDLKKAKTDAQESLESITSEKDKTKAELEVLQSKMQSTQRMVAELNNTVAGIQSKHHGLSREVQVLQLDKDRLLADIANLQEEEKRLKAEIEELKKAEEFKPEVDEVLSKAKAVSKEANSLYLAKEGIIRSIETFISLIRIRSHTGNESTIRKELKDALESLGGRTILECDRDNRRCNPNGENTNIPKNLVIEFSATGEFVDKPGIIINAHMDTVSHSTPEELDFSETIKGFYHKTQGSFGADDKAGVVVLLEALRFMKENYWDKNCDHRRILFILTAREEPGLEGFAYGAKHLAAMHPEIFKNMLFSLTSDGPLDLGVSNPDGSYVIVVSDEHKQKKPYSDLIKTIKDFSSKKDRKSELTENGLGMGDFAHFPEFANRNLHLRSPYEGNHAHEKLKIVNLIDHIDLWIAILLNHACDIQDTKTSAIGRKVLKGQLPRIVREFIVNKDGSLMLPSGDQAPLIGVTGFLASKLEKALNNLDHLSPLGWKRPKFINKISIVQGNDRLAETDILTGKIVLDVDAFESDSLLDLELEHELFHSILQDGGWLDSDMDNGQKMPAAIEEILVLLFESVHFLSLDFASQQEIIKLLESDNEIDDQDFCKILKKFATNNINLEIMIEDIISYVRDRAIYPDNITNYLSERTVDQIWSELIYYFARNYPEDLFVSIVDRLMNIGRPAWSLLVRLAISRYIFCKSGYNGYPIKVGEIIDGVGIIAIDACKKYLEDENANVRHQAASIFHFSKKYNDLGENKAGSAKGKGINMFAPEEHAEVNQVIEKAQKDNKGLLIYGKIQGWKDGRDRYGKDVEKAISSLKDYTSIELPGLGKVNIPEILAAANVILIQPRNNSPGLVVKDMNTYQVAHSGANRDSIYIDQITYQLLLPKEIAALLAHEAIELAAKKLALEKNIAWTSELAQKAHRIAEEYETQIVGKSLVGDGSRLDDKIREILLPFYSPGPELPKNEGVSIKTEGDKEYLKLDELKCERGRGGISVPRIDLPLTPTNRFNLKEILKDVGLTENTLLVGETGTGKSSLVLYLARLLNRECKVMSLNEDTDVKDLLVRQTFGEKQAGMTGWTDSVLVEAMRNGTYIILDEIDRVQPGVLSSLNNILQFRQVTLPNGEVVTAHPDFRVFATMNPPRPPYMGNLLSGELEDRFSIHTIDYLSKDEEVAVLQYYAPRVNKTMLDLLVDVANNLRASYKQGILPRPLSTRALIRIVKHLERYPDEDVRIPIKKAYNLEYLNANAQTILEKVLETYGLSKKAKEGSKIRASRGVDAIISSQTEGIKQLYEKVGHFNDIDEAKKIAERELASIRAKLQKTEKSKEEKNTALNELRVSLIEAEAEGVRVVRDTLKEAIDRLEPDLRSVERNTEEVKIEIGNYERLLELYLSLKTVGQRIYFINKTIEGQEKEFLVIDDIEYERSQDGSFVPKINLEHTGVNIDHLRDILRGIILDENILLVGETGTGKSSLILHMAELLNRNCRVMSLNEDTDVKDLLIRQTFGEKEEGKTGWSDSVLVDAMRSGDYIILDEIDRVQPGVLSALNNILQFRQITLPNGEVVTAHPNFRVFATMNPPKPPYTGNLLSGELEDRFSIYTIDYLPKEEEVEVMQNHAPNIERSILEQLVDAANNLRASYRQGFLPRPLSTRALVKVANHLQTYPEDDVIDILRKAYNLEYLNTDAQAAVEKVLKLYNFAKAKKPVVSQPTPSPVPQTISSDVQPGLLPWQNFAPEETAFSPEESSYSAEEQSYNAEEATFTPQVNSSDRIVPEERAAVAEIEKSLRGHSGDVMSVAYSADGGLIASGSKDGTLKLWNLETGEISTLTGHGGEIWVVAISPNKRWVASAGTNGNLKVWNLENRTVKTLKGHTDSILSTIGFSQDSNTLVTGSRDKTVRVWNLETGRVKILTGHEKEIEGTAISPNGELVASGGWDSAIRVWNLGTNRVKVLNGHSGAVGPLVFAADGENLISASTDTTVKVWNLRTNQVTTLRGHNSPVWSVAISNGRYVASGDEKGVVKIWDLNNNRVKTLSAHSGTTASVSFAPNGNDVVSGGFDDVAKIWNITKDRVLITRQAEEDLRRQALQAATQVQEPTAQLEIKTKVKTVNDQRIEYLTIGNVEIPKGQGGLYVPPIKLEQTPTNLLYLKELLKDVILGENTLLVGETGTGKSSLVLYLANLTNRECKVMSLNEDTDVRDLLVRQTFGEKEAGKTGWTDSVLVEAMRNGTYVILDEIDRVQPGVLSSLNNILQFRQVTLPNGDIVTAHPDFRVFATMNPPRPPYTGNLLSGELEDRFSIYNIDYLPEQEEITVLKTYAPKVKDLKLKKLIKVANDLRNAYKNGLLPRPLSTRALVRIVKHLNDYPKDDIMPVVKKAYNLEYLNNNAQGVVDKVLEVYGLTGKKTPPKTPPINFTAPFITPKIDPISFRMVEPAQPTNNVTSVPQGLIQLLEGLARIITNNPILKMLPWQQMTPDDTQRTWRYLFGLNQIQYLPEDLTHRDEDIPSALTMHEVWHVIFSNPDIMEEDFRNNRSFWTLLNPIEDPRVNNIGIRKYGGSEPWIEKLYSERYGVKNLEEEKNARQSQPLHLQFGYGLIYKWFTGEDDPRITNQKVKDALKQCDNDIIAAYSTDSPKESYEIIRDKIWPIYQKLIEEATNNAVNNQVMQKMAEKGQLGDKMVDKNGKPLPADQIPEDMKEQLQEKIQKELEKMTPEEAQELASRAAAEVQEAEKEFNKEFEGKMAPEPAPSDKDITPQEKAYKEQFEKGTKELREAAGESEDESGESLEQKSEKAKNILEGEKISKGGISSVEEAEYEEYLRPVKPFVLVLKRHLLMVLQKTARSRMQKGRSFGDINSEALAEIPTGTDRIFQRDLKRGKFNYRIVLLIDGSYSMKRESIRYKKAIEGTVLLMEALKDIPGIDFEISIFNDRTPYLPLKKLGERVTKKKAVETVKGIEANVGVDTRFDAGCIAKAIERIQSLKRSNKDMLIVITDGNPDRPETQERQELEKLFRGAKGIKIFGVGIGPEAKQVAKVYPHGVWVEDLSRLSIELSSILRKELKAPEPTGPWGSYAYTDHSRQETISELAKIGKDAVPDLTNALSNPNSDIRNGAVEALEKIGDAKALPGLKSLREKEPDNSIVARAIEALERRNNVIEQKSEPKEIVEDKLPYNMNIGETETLANNFISNIIVKAKEAKKLNQKLIIGFETSWIPGYEKGKLEHMALNPLIRELGKLEQRLNKLGLDNVIIVNKSGDDLAGELLSSAEKTNTSLSNVIALASQSTVNSKAFDNLRSTKNEKKAFIAAVNTDEFDKYCREHPEDSDRMYIRIVEMLSIALELSLGKEPPNNPLIISYDQETRIVIFMPKPEPVDFKELKMRYDAEKQAIVSA